ncbi:endolytic transglycosylase MltG [Conexibacter sp. DBS9H8]|uniref:endolytic transglycosylase MltG n=1 Tax=Conexibacter sp. DBS9H8 TaxID=2937801 RepID=UPI00200E6F36|nr:endolytic transglycosylase MltG [Conexibacter sp. DBS9H8]
MSDSHERSEMEREAARRAREARRSERASTPPVLRMEAPPASTERPARPAGRRPATPRTPLSSRLPSPPRARRPRGVRRVRLLFLGLCVVLVVIVGWFLNALLQPLGGSGSGQVRVNVPEASSTAAVGDLLARDGVVASGFFFKIRAELAGDHFRAGTYRLAHGMSYSAALTALLKGPALPPSVEVTIIPGKSRYQLDRLLHAEAVPGSYLAATVHSPLLNPRRYGAPAHPPSLEGFLYPDTYQLPKPLSISALVADQLTRFKVEMAKVNLAYAAAHNLTAYDVLKIASLEDAEAALPGDLAKVASVIYNRLALGMDLGLDTTAAYAANNYSGNLTAAQLASRSPWNTLNHPGLPPTPIDSPDLAAIEAAAHPAHTHDLYFIVRVCGNGALNFTSSYPQFLLWSRQYDAALAARGARRTEFCGHG